MTTTNTFPAAILFDHDGTLVDTEPVWAAAKVALTAEFGGTWTEQDTLDCLGLSMKFTLDRLRERGVDLPDAHWRLASARILLLICSSI